MISNQQKIRDQPTTTWPMPIVPESYDRSPLTSEERWALERYSMLTARDSGTKEAIAVRRTLTRLDQPIMDVFHLRHQSRSARDGDAAIRIMRREMHRHRKIFWQWTVHEWMETLCPTPAIFYTQHEKRACAHMAIMDVAYLLGEVSDLRPAGIGLEVAEAANLYFGADLIAQQCQRVADALQDKGFSAKRGSMFALRQGLSMLFILKRSPYLEDISEELLAEVAAESREMRHTSGRISIALRELKLLSSPLKEDFDISCSFDASGMAREWYEWCLSWYERAVDLTPRQRRSYVGHILAVGRWLYQYSPVVRTPEQWTEDLALHLRSDICSWTCGQYVSRQGQHLLRGKGALGKPMKPQAIACYLTAIRRYLTDLTKRPHAVGGAPARRITLDFVPGEALAVPDSIRRALDQASPRDIDLRVWTRLAIAAATLSQSDLPHNTRYPLSFYRALGLVWVTSARRPNEIARLRLDCVREDWDPAMLDEDGQSVEKLIRIDANGQQPVQEGATHPKIYYLHIPTGKNRGPFWIWIPDYVADAITIWKNERPRNQCQLFDQEGHENVDYLFCYQDARVGYAFMNDSLIPVLCAKAGVASEDAKGRITGHRGRSTRLTLLRSRGVSLDDLAEYAGHADSRTIRRYARQNPIQLHRIIRDADDVSRVIEGVVDIQAATKGLPALRWFIGYDADGEPMYCGNQLYVTCPHRLDCERCGMFIGAEKARLLQKGENTLPVTSKVPMTPLEKCVVEGDQEGAAAYRAALQHIPAPETPDLRLIFNPEGLSNYELEKLAEIASVEALEKLHQALDAHEKKWAEMQQQHKTGRNALVTAQKKRITFIQELIAGCEQRRHEHKGE